MITSSGQERRARSAAIRAMRKDGVVLTAVKHSVRRPLCEHCGSRFTAKSRAVRLCSDECKRADAATKQRHRSAANDNKQQIDCAECGCAFSPTYGDKRSVYCSKDCSKRSARRVARKAARARIRSVTVDQVNPTKVFDRDGWACVECGVDTPRELRGTYEPNAPELDHIMPLSKGGEHSYANTQCLCRQCNAAKSDTIPLAA